MTNTDYHDVRLARRCFESPEFKADLAEARRLVRNEDWQGLAAFANRNVDERARLAHGRLA